MNPSRFEHEFYQRPALLVAKDLLGTVLVHKTKAGITKGKIVEVEAYMGSLDKAAHSYKNIITPRTEILYGEGGFAYVYLIYGMYHCMNVVCNVVDKPECVLIRALEPLEGIDLMKERRKTDKILNLCSGPGKLSSAMGITKEQNGFNLSADIFYIEKSTDKAEDIEIETSKRINIGYAEEAIEYPWRFMLKDNKFVSYRKV
ncbi:MAG: DNA-3-methyladenine glycosylase [Clostridiales bacterium]|nr:DNA-3-methyladenine glycosylase [Clostridiales bacterium]